MEDLTPASSSLLRGVAAEPPSLFRMLAAPMASDRMALAGSFGVILLMIVVGHRLVELGGGTQYAYTYALLVPVLTASCMFHVTGGVVVGLLAGIVIGPWMPLDTVAGIDQATGNWIVRLCWFVGLGAFVGVLTAVPRWRKAVRDRRMLVDDLSGLLAPDALRLFRRPAGPAYAIAVDFGLYERIQDTHGRSVAAEFVRTVAGHLVAALRETRPSEAARLTRVRSDVFGFLLPHDAVALTATIDAVRERLPRWVALEEADRGVGPDPGADPEPVVVPITVHVGISEVGPADLADLDAFRNSIRAARVGRESNRPVMHYDRASAPVARENMQMAAELLQAIERGELFLVFQPEQSLAGGHIPAVEALLRWRSPRRGLVPPTRFIPVAEQSSLINVLTRWVLDRSGETMRDWRAAGRALRLSVNLSGRDLLDDRVLERLRHLPAMAGVAAGSFSLEITETAFIDDLDAIGRQLEMLRDIGYDLLVDDFGTGCSSFAYLHRLPVHGVKIDRTFVSAIRTDDTAADLVQSMLDWSRHIGKRTIAEGVEDAETADLLRTMGCDEIQGYWISRPLPGDELLPWLDARTGTDRPAA